MKIILKDNESAHIEYLRNSKLNRNETGFSLQNMARIYNGRQIWAKQ
jgi:hypothetical protein